MAFIVGYIKSNNIDYLIIINLAPHHHVKVRIKDIAVKKPQKYQISWDHKAFSDGKSKKPINGSQNRS